MVQEIIEDVLWSFIKNVARKIGVGIRWIWFGRKLTFEKILESKWNVRLGIIILFLIFACIIAFTL